MENVDYMKSHFFCHKNNTTREGQCTDIPIWNMHDTKWHKNYLQLPQLPWFAEHHLCAVGHVALSNQAWPLHAFALLYLLLLLEVSSLGEDEFPSVLPPAHARGLLALAERPVHLQRAVGEKGAVGFRSPGLYRVGRGSHKSPSATTVWSPPGQVAPRPVKRQDRVTKSPGLQSWYSRLKGKIFVLECPSSSRSQVVYFTLNDTSWDSDKRQGDLNLASRRTELTDNCLVFSLGRNHSRARKSKQQHKACWLVLLSFATFPPKTPSDPPGNLSALKTKPTTCGKLLGSESLHLKTTGWLYKTVAPEKPFWLLYK